MVIICDKRERKMLIAAESRRPLHDKIQSPSCKPMPLKESLVSIRALFLILWRVEFFVALLLRIGAVFVALLAGAALRNGRSGFLGITKRIRVGT